MNTSSSALSNLMISPSHIVSLLINEFGHSVPASYSRHEIKLAGELIRVLRDASISDVEPEVSEEVICEDEDDIDFHPAEDYPDEGIGSGSMKFGDKEIPEATLKECLTYYRKPGKGQRTFRSLRNRYRFLRNSNDMKKLRQYEKEGSLRVRRRTAMKKIADHLSVEVNRLLSTGQVFHDQELRQLALKINHDHQLIPGFLASHSWIHTFKRNFGLVSRRITKFVSTKNFANKDQIDDDGKKFVEKVRDAMKNNPQASFVNADQSGFLKEMSTARTLAPIGVRKVEKVVQNQSATTHSFTMMPLLFSDGRLGEKLFIQLQEKNGVFPAKGFFQTPNLEVRAGTSHIMNKKTMQEWVSSCLFSPNSPQSQFLIIDSWSSFKDHASIFALVPPNKELQIANIPAGATSMVQPLDVFFFRPFKGMVRRFTSFIQVNDIKIVVSQRDNILKMISLIYHQFTAPCFKEFLQYSWFKSGYFDNHPGPFETPLQCCFPMDAPVNCSTAGCLDATFIKCAHCHHTFCFSHFFVAYHIC